MHKTLFALLNYGDQKKGRKLLPKDDVPLVGGCSLENNKSKLMIVKIAFKMKSKMGSCV